MVDFEQAIVSAIAERFFQPVITGFSPDGQPYYGPAAFETVAHRIYRDCDDEIIEAIKPNIDIDDIAARVAKQVNDTLAASRSSWHSDRSEADKLRTAINARVIDLLAEEECKAFRARLAAEVADRVDS